MSCGHLPRADKYMLHHDSWLHRRLGELQGQAHLPVLEQFATWCQLPKLRARANRQSLTPSAGSRAAQQFNRAHEFLNWLAEQDLALDEVGQTEIDHWHASHSPHEQGVLRMFPGRSPDVPDLGT